MFIHRTRSMILRFGSWRCVFDRLALGSILFLSFFFFSGAASRVVKGRQDVPLLITGSPVEREMSEGQSHGYQIKLDAGQYAHVVVGQRGLDVVIKVFGPDGKQVAEVDRLFEGEETVDLVAEAAGSYRLEVS